MNRYGVREGYGAIDPPVGFQVVFGLTGYEDTDDYRSNLEQHLYALGPDKTVLCFTPGQFACRRAPYLRPGDRMAELVEAIQNGDYNPDLIKDYGGGIFRLFGGISEIKRATGLIYR